MIFTLSAFGQKSAVDKVFDKFKGKDGYTTVYISSYMFNMMSSLESDDPDYNEFKKATAGINSIKILTQDGGDSESFGKELISMLPRSEYKEMMVVQDQEEEVLFLAREEGNKITEFLLIVSGGRGRCPHRHHRRYRHGKHFEDCFRTGYARHGQPGGHG